MMRRKRTLLKIGLVGILFTVPAVAAPPHAPSDQYDYFDRQSLLIYDRKTQLLWDREIPLAKAKYADAESYCKFTFNGGNGGRLPTIKELLTLLDEEPSKDYQSGAVVEKLIDPDAFPRDSAPIDVPYWTSTATEPAGSVWTLSFANGDMSPRARNDELHYRCVKFGQ